jgi:hypothetical protein
MQLWDQWGQPCGVEPDCVLELQLVCQELRHTDCMQRAPSCFAAAACTGETLCMTL